MRGICIYRRFGILNFGSIYPALVRYDGHRGNDCFVHSVLYTAHLSTDGVRGPVFIAVSYEVFADRADSSPDNVLFDLLSHAQAPYP